MTYQPVQKNKRYAQMSDVRHLENGCVQRNPEQHQMYSRLLVKYNYKKFERGIIKNLAKPQLPV